MRILLSTILLGLFALAEADISYCEAGLIGFDSKPASAPRRAVESQIQKTSQLQPDTIRRIEDIIQSEMTQLKIPGLSISIAVDYQLIYAKGFGMADLENSVPATTATVFRTASVAKPITGLAVMQLVENGKLKLDAPIQKYCPAFPFKKWSVTVRQLLAHQGGIRHTRNNEDRSTEHYFSIEESLKIFKDDPLEIEPGTKYSYTTLGYNLLGCAIEGASGMSYEQYMREQVFRPAGMEHTGLDNHFEIIPHRARGYIRLSKQDYARLPKAAKSRVEPGQILNAWMHDTSMKVPGGGLVSTPVDLVNFGIAVGTDVLVKKTTREEMWTPQRNSRVRDTVHALGWASVGEGSGRFVTYNGSQPGVSTEFYLVPDRGIVIAVMANLYDVPLGLGRIRDRILEELTRRPH
jgi:CubicO group peptidase (beta-lactamase class C family)